MPKRWWRGFSALLVALLALLLAHLGWDTATSALAPVAEIDSVHPMFPRRAVSSRTVASRAPTELPSDPLPAPPPTVVSLDLWSDGRAKFGSQPDYGPDCEREPRRAGPWAIAERTDGYPWPKHPLNSTKVDDWYNEVLADYAPTWQDAVDEGDAVTAVLRLQQRFDVQSHEAIEGLGTEFEPIDDDLDEVDAALQPVGDDWDALLFTRLMRGSESSLYDALDIQDPGLRRGALGAAASRSFNDDYEAREALWDTCPLSGPPLCHCVTLGKVALSTDPVSRTWLARRRDMVERSCEDGLPCPARDNLVNQEARVRWQLGESPLTWLEAVAHAAWKCDERSDAPEPDVVQGRWGWTDGGWKEVWRNGGSSAITSCVFEATLTPSPPAGIELVLSIRKSTRLF